MLENASHIPVSISYLTCCLSRTSIHEPVEHKVRGLQLGSGTMSAIGSLPECQCGVHLRVDSDRVQSIHKLLFYNQHSS
jgi:hypothetical protein